MVVVGAHAVAQLGDGRVRVVGVGRREVRQDLAAVDPLPREGVVLGAVEAVPRELLGEEARHPGLAHELRQLAGVAEDVGLPELGAAPAQLALEEALAVQQLAGERLARGQVAVRLDPRAADRRPLPAGDALADRGEQRRVLARGSTRSAGPGEAQKTCSGYSSVSRTWVVNVRSALRRVSSSGHSQAVSRCAWPIADSSCGPPAAWRSYSPVRIAPAGAQVARSSASHALQKSSSPASSSPANAGSRPASSSSARRTPKSCTRRQASGSKRASSQASRTNGERVRYGPCAPSPWTPKPNMSLHAISSSNARRLPAARRGDERGVGADLAAPAAQALHGAAVAPQRRLAAGVEHEVDPLPGPGLGHRRGDPQPPGREQRPELGAERDRRVVEGRGRRPVDAARRARDLHACRPPRARDARARRGGPRCGPAGRACTGGAGARAAGDPTRSCGRQRVGAGGAAPGQSAGGAARTIESCGASARARNEKHHGRR